MKKSTSNQQNHLKCKECKLVVLSDEEDSVACDICDTWVHFQCTKLNKKEILSIKTNKDSSYECNTCNPGVTSNNDDYKQILLKLNELTSTVKFLAAKHDDFMTTMKDHKTRLKRLEKENKTLKDELKSVSEDQAVLFTELHKNKVIVKGIRESAVQSADSLEQLVKDIALKMGSSINFSDISSTRLLNNKNNTPGTSTNSRPRSAIVEFTSFQKKLDFVKKRKELKKLEDFKQITISDLLSKTTQKLFIHSLMLKSVGYVAVYHQNGIIFAKKSPEVRPTVIRSMDQVDKLTKEAASQSHRNIRQDDLETENDDEYDTS